MSDKENFLWEFAVWGNLDATRDTELILLKGHLLLEMVLETAIGNSGIKNLRDYSFFKKVRVFENIAFKNSEKHKFLVYCLLNVNRLRNTLAHEFEFEINDGKLTLWSDEILQNLVGEKYTRFTHRTRIVHSFSILAKNILDLK